MKLSYAALSLPLLTGCMSIAEPISENYIITIVPPNDKSIRVPLLYSPSPNLVEAMITDQNGLEHHYKSPSYSIQLKEKSEPAKKGTLSSTLKSIFGESKTLGYSLVGAGEVNSFLVSLSSEDCSESLMVRLGTQDSIELCRYNISFNEL